MTETSARLLRLLSLLQTRRDWTSGELADRTETTTRTVRRDVERLRRLGYPVDAAPGPGGGYRLGVGATLPPLLLDDDEAVAVAVGLRGAALSGVAGIEETAVRALATVEQMLPSRLRLRVATLQAAIEPMPGAGPRVDADVLVTVASAVRDSRQLRVEYRGRDGQESRRMLEPHRMVPAGRRWYLVAWDVERSDWRTFRLDRFVSCTATGPRFTPREAPDPDLPAYLSRAITTRPYRYQCRLTVHAPAENVGERIPPTAATITPVDEESCELVTGSDSLDEVALYVGLVGAEITVHEPAELRDRMAALGALLARAASG